MTEPLVLIPGLNCTDMLFADQVAELGRARAVSVADHRQDESIAAMAARAIAAAPERFALAGLSMGGYVALEIMRMAPGRVTRLALLDTSARPDTLEATARRRRLMELAGRDFTAVHGELWPILVAPARRNDAELEARVRAMADETGPEAFVRQERAIIGRMDSRPFLASIAVPTLVLVGEHDALTPPDDAIEMKQAIPGASLAVIEEAGHLTALERPGEVSAALAAWLERPAA